MRILTLSFSLNPIYHVSVDHQLTFCYCWIMTLWNARNSPQRKFFEKKECFTQDLNLGPQKLYFSDLVTCHYITRTRHRNCWWLWNLYDLDCVDDQHSHGKSVGKYHMVNRFNEDAVWVNSGSMLKGEVGLLRSRKMCSKAPDNMSSNEALHHFTTTWGTLGDCSVTYFVKLMF